MTDDSPDGLPEGGPERRAAITRRIQAATGLDDAALGRLVRAFYDRARGDAEIGHLFDDVQDWEHHVARITTFWSSVALLTGGYHGQPMPAHVKLGLQPRHFVRWLALFEETARGLFAEATVAYLMTKARRIGASLQMGIAVTRGELPPRVRPAAG